MEQQFKVLKKDNVTRYFKVLPLGGCEEITKNDIPHEILEELLNPTSSNETSSETKTSRRSRTKTTEE